MENCEAIEFSLGGSLGKFFGPACCGCGLIGTEVFEFGPGHLLEPIGKDGENLFGLVLGQCGFWCLLIELVERFPDPAHQCFIDLLDRCLTLRHVTPLDIPFGEYFREMLVYDPANHCIGCESRGNLSELLVPLLPDHRVFLFDLIGVQVLVFEIPCLGCVEFFIHSLVYQIEPFLPGLHVPGRGHEILKEVRLLSLLGDLRDDLLDDLIQVSLKETIHALHVTLNEPVIVLGLLRVDHPKNVVGDLVAAPLRDHVAPVRQIEEIGKLVNLSLLGGGAFTLTDLIEDLPDSLYTSGPVYFEFREMPEDPAAFHERFCPAFLPWFYKNNPNARGEQQMVDGTDLCIPALWCEDRTLIAYSKNGYENKTWKLPPDWKDATRVSISRITLQGQESHGLVPVVDGRITLSVGKGEALRICAA